MLFGFWLKFAFDRYRDTQQKCVCDNNKLATMIKEIRFFATIKGGVLKDTFWSPWPWPPSLKSSKIALSRLDDSTIFLIVKIL